MELIESETFREWCTTHSIGRSLRYPRSESLTYLPEPSIWYRYRPNTTPHGLAVFVGRALALAAADTPLWAFPTWRGGRWWPVADWSDWGSQALAAVVRGVGVPKGFIGAIRFELAELPLVTLLLTSALQFESAGFWELTVVPDHGRCIIYNEEDGDLIGVFPTESWLDSYTSALRKTGWNEPTEPDPRVSETDPWLDLQRGPKRADGGAA
jgi:hypothetical protein